MKTVMMAIVILVTAASAFGQQSTTKTDCDVNDQQVNCKSTTTDHPNAVPPGAGALYGINKALAANRARAEARKDQNAQQGQEAQLSQEAIKELLAEEKQERENRDTVDFIYCRQNVKGSVTDYDGNRKTCAEVIEYTKAFCLVNPEVERCALAKSKADVEKAFAALVNNYNGDSRRNKKDAQMYYDSLFAKLTKWGCMSFPEMTVPQRDGTLHPCPDAPEPAPVSANTVSETK